MKRLFLAVALALSLGACSTVQAITGATITQAQVDAARNGYDGGFLAGLHRYALLPRCKTGQTLAHDQCHDAATLKKLRAVDHVIEQDFASVQANLDAGNTSALMNAWAILTNAIQSADTLAIQLGVS